MAVYWDRRVEIPKEHVVRERQANGAPALVKYVLSSRYDRTKGYPVAKRTTIGHQCSDDASFMHPTTQYAALFPEQWAALDGAQTRQPATVCIGLRAAAAAVEPACGLKTVLDETFGEQRAGALLDAAAEALRRGAGVPLSERGLPNAATSSDCIFTDEEVLLFRRRWATQCREGGANAVWLCVDSLQGDWESPGAEILEAGQEQTEEEKRAPYLIYAVTADGMPASWEFLPNGLQDGSALDRITDFLGDCGIQGKGVVALRGRFDTALLRSLQNRDLGYLILLQEVPRAYEEAFATFAARGKRDAMNWIPGTTLFGTQLPVRLLGEGEPRQTLTLLYDHHIGDARINALLERLQRETAFNRAELQREMDRAGVYIVLSSGAMPLRQVASLLSALSASERQVLAAGCEMGSGRDVLRDPVPQRTRLFVGFLAAILRHQMEQAASAAGLEGEEVLGELCGVETQMDNGRFSDVYSESETVQAFFRSLGGDADSLLQAAVQRLNGKPAVRATSTREHPSNTAPDEQDAPAQAVEHRQRGVPQGTKRPDLNKDGTPRKRPGVRPGTRRGALNKDGTPRRKPGPKGKGQAAQD